MSAPVDVLLFLGRSAAAAKIDAHEYSDSKILADHAEQALLSHVAVFELIATMENVAEYLADREDVIDGDYGQPAPNKEMTLLREVRAALAACGVKP